MIRESIGEERSTSLDILKGICVVLIILTHTSLTNVQKKEMFAPFWIWAAVTLYMIISGYNYCRNYKSVNEWFQKDVFSRRAGRIIFPYIIALIIEFCYRFIYVRESVGVVKIINDFLSGGAAPVAIIFPCFFSL